MNFAIYKAFHDQIRNRGFHFRVDGIWNRVDEVAARP